MGMSLIYRRLSDEQRARLERDPPYAASLFPAGTPPPLPPEMLAQVKARMKTLGLLRRILIWWLVLRKMGNREVLSLDKSWHTIHFLLTGDKSVIPRHLPASPLHNVIMGGRATPVDSAYGPVRVLEKPDVKAIAAALASIDDEALKNRYSIAELNAAQIYGAPKPGGWDVRELAMVYACIPRLKQFFADAAASDECIGIAVV